MTINRFFFFSFSTKILLHTSENNRKRCVYEICFHDNIAVASRTGGGGASLAERAVLLSRSWCSVMLYTASDGRRDESDGPRDCDDGRTRRGRVATVQRQRESVHSYNIFVVFDGLRAFRRRGRTWNFRVQNAYPPPQRHLTPRRPSSDQFIYTWVHFTWCYIICAMCRTYRSGIVTMYSGERVWRVRLSPPHFNPLSNLPFFIYIFFENDFQIIFSTSKWWTLHVLLLCFDFARE
jgi:hypothetical protein